MATKKTEETAVDYTSMNAMQKLQIALGEIDSPAVCVKLDRERLVLR